MMRELIFLLSLLGNFLFAQTSFPNLNRDLAAMKTALQNKNFEMFVDYIYPKSFDLTGGKSNTINMMKMMYAKIGKDMSIQSISHKTLGKVINYKNEMQLALEEESVLKTPKGIQKTSSTMIAISTDKGKNWKFLNTLNQPKEQLLKLFPNLSPNLDIQSKMPQPKKQTQKQ